MEARKKEVIYVTGLSTSVPLYMPRHGVLISAQALEWWESTPSENGDSSFYECSLDREGDLAPCDRLGLWGCMRVYGPHMSEVLTLVDEDQ